MDNINRDPKGDNEDQADPPAVFALKLAKWFGGTLFCIIVLLVVVAYK